MLGVLQSEEDDDIKKKEECETDRAADTRSAIDDSRKIDGMSDLISTTEAQVEELKRNIADKQEQVAAIDAELKEAKRIREDENAEYLAAKKEDEDAKQLVDNAAAVLSTFYTENGLMLAQKKQKQPAVAAGAAPPPPPATWEAPYGGKTGETTGIVAVLKMISEDITKDIAHADGNEQASLDLYTKTKGALEGEKGDLTTLIGSLEIEQGQKETTITDTKGERRTKKGTLEATLSKIRAAEAGCDFFTLNFPVRSQNRQVEIDGLHKAKAILSGATFDAPDPNREIKPGDALLQNLRRHRF